MFKKLLLFVLSAAVLVCMPQILFAQSWEDTFEDDDVGVRMNVGWNYYGPEDGLTGATVEQRGGELFMEAGSFSGLVDAVVAVTNGVPKIEFDATGDPTPETVAAIKKNDYTDVNPVFTFQVNFKKLAPTSFFIVGLRMVIDDDSLDSDPTASPAYSLFCAPLAGQLGLAKYQGPMAVLDPTAWTYFAQGGYSFALDVYYWMKLYLKDGDFKFKVWEGDATDEPAEWLMKGTDTEPRITGRFITFGLLNPKPTTAKDQVVIDNVKMDSASATIVRAVSADMPEGYALHQNFPNPFNPSTEIRYDVQKQGHVSLAIYNAIGQKVATIFEGVQAPGSYRTIWDGSADNGEKAPAGLYFYHLQADGFSKTMKMVLMK